MTLRKREPRAETFVPGILIDSRGQAVDCIIQNLSEGGAQVRLEGMEPPESSMLLVLPRSPRARYVSCVWRQHFDYGLRFEQEIDLRAPERPIERVARSLWIELGPTEGRMSARPVGRGSVEAQLR